MFNKIISLVPGIERKKRAWLREIMRGYRTLKKTGRLGAIAGLKQALTEHGLGLDRKAFSPAVFGCAADSGELILRQYLLVWVAGLDLNTALLRAVAKEGRKVVFALPIDWRDVFEQHGFKVARFRSAVVWQCYVGAFFLYGVLTIARIACTGIVGRREARTRPKTYVYFADLGVGNLPEFREHLGSHDVISWYLQWSGRKSDIDAVRHGVVTASPVTVGNVLITGQRRPLPALSGWGEIFRFVRWGLRAVAVSAIDGIRGRYWHALLLSQSALAAQARIVPAECLARDYFFHNSGWIYRPLWTYESERRGSNTNFYFYSTNCEPFKRPDGYPPMPYGWRAMNWPRYLVWDEYQADFVRRAVGDRPEVSVVGPISFQGNAEQMPKLSKAGVALFDVTPHRASRYSILGLDNEFYTPAVANPFLQHVSNVTRRRGIPVLWKRKRNIGRIAHPSYRHLADRLGDCRHVVCVNPEISAVRVIEASIAVLSMPFTSTALIARAMGKPSAYYDPTGQLLRDDRAAHGIPILSGEAELEEWLAAQCAGSKTAQHRPLKGERALCPRL